MFDVPALRRLEQTLERQPTEHYSKLHRDSLSRSQRRAHGVYYTPPALVDFVIGILPAGVRGRPRLRVLDPSCGDGRFLAGIASAVAPTTELELIGFERDSTRADSARRALADVGARVRTTIYSCEALTDAPQIAPVDMVLGNPPYQRSIHLRQHDPQLWRRLRGAFAATSFGEWDIYGAFLEKSLDWLKPDGLAAFVVPSRWLTARYATKLRQKLSDHQSVRSLIDFGTRQIFDGATTYTSVVTLSRQKNSECLIARASDDGWDIGRQPHPRDHAPWRFTLGRDGDWVHKVESLGPSLGSIARIAKGTGTNADGVFVVDGGRSRVEDGIRLESAALRACLRGRDIANGRASYVQCIVPYDDSGRLVGMAAWPQTFAYLCRHRTRLEGRERGRFAGDQFYRFGRPQNLAFHLSLAPKLVIPDLARQPRATIDRSGALVLDSAYAIRLLPPTDSGASELAPVYTLETLRAIFLSDAVAKWLRANGISVRGDYVRMKTAYLSSLPVPLSLSGHESRSLRDVERAYHL